MESGSSLAAVEPREHDGEVECDDPAAVLSASGHQQDESERRECDVAAQLPDGNRSVRTWIATMTRAVLVGFKEHDLLTYSSAMSYQILTSVVPFVLFILAAADLANASDVWQQHLQPQIQAAIPPAMFNVIRDSVGAVNHHQIFWVSLGGLLTLWQVSGAVRAIMGAMGRIYGAPAERPFLRRYTVSFILSIEVSVCFVGIALCLLFAPFVSLSHAALPLQVLGFVVRWVLVIALLVLMVGLLVRHAPSRSQTVSWVTTGAAIVVVCWLGASSLFYLYLDKVANYDSVFGSLAAVIVTFAYLYISTTVFLFGTQVDAIIRVQATGRPAGETPS